MARHLPTEEDARACGRALAAEARPGAVIALVGAMGAGKTHLTKGIAEGLGYAGEVTSPTFTLVHEYAAPAMRLPVFHFDFYRLESADEALAFGLEEYLEAGGVCVVEWADKFPALLPREARWWQLRPSEKGGREIEEITGDVTESTPRAAP